MTTPMKRDEVFSLLNTYFQALQAGKVDELPFTPNITFEGPMAGTIQGEKAVRELVIDVANTFKDIKIDVLGHIVDGNEICSRAAMTLPGGETVALLDYFRFEDGKIAHIQPYFDSRPMLELWGFADNSHQGS